MRKPKPTERGGAMLEFALICPVLLPLLLGTMWTGIAMIRGLQVTQVARDAASMFCRGGVDFSDTTSTDAPNQILTMMTRELGTITSSGTGVMIFSTLTYVGNSVCAAAGSAYHDSSTPPQHTAACTNYGHFVFTQRYTVGNSGLHASAFGAPASADPDSTNLYRITTTNYITHTTDRSSFNLLPAPLENGTDGYQSGQPIYLVEAYFTGLGQPGYGSGGTYAYAVF
jgi:Flp pilus assembly protein TadG